MLERDPLTIGVVLKTYPKLSETFILEELLGLERLGLRLAIYSLQQPTDDRANSETAMVRAPVHYPPDSSMRLIGEHLRSALRRPMRYAAAIVAAARTGDLERWSNVRDAGWLAAESDRARLQRFHVHFLSRPAAVTQIAARMTGRPFSISGHAKDIYLTDPASLRRKLSAAEFTVTCTEHNRDHLLTLAPPGAVVDCVHHGVEPSRFVPAVQQPRPPVLLGVGRLRRKKGFDLLVEACARLCEAGVDFQCRIVGYGPEDGALRAQVQALGLDDRVHFMGKCTRDEVIEQYRLASVLVQPCRVTADGDRDGIPNVLLEAMAMEVPVVSTPISGIPELIDDGCNGVLVAENDADAVADAVAALLRDPTRCRDIGRRGREAVETSFSAEASAGQIAKRLSDGGVGYVVKGYPRLSELFIATEIYRVERLGLPVRLFVLKPADEPVHHRVVHETTATAERLPPMTSISKRPAWRWVRENLPCYVRPLRRVARRSPCGFATAARDAGAQAWRARKGRWPRKLYLKEFLQAAAIADQVLSDKQIRHLHAHFCHGATTVTWLAATMTGRTFSFTAHAKDIYRADLNPAGLLERKLRAAAFAVTCTEANRAHLQAIAPDARVTTIYHGLNEEFSQLLQQHPRKSEAGGAGRFTVLGVGRLVPKKGFDILIDAAAMLVQAGIDVDIRIVGENGEHGDALRELVARHQLDTKVRFLGPMDQRGLFEEYRNADAFVLPCRVLANGDRDGIPNVLAEAMAAGVPVVSTTISGIPELVTHRENGLLVAPDNPDVLAKAILELHDDPELAQRLSDTAISTIRADFDGWVTTRHLADLLRAAARA